MTRSRIIRRLAALLLTTVCLSTAGHAQEVSDPEALFVPDAHVPLSEFQRKTSLQFTVTLNVDPMILDWIDNDCSEITPVEVAVCASNGTITYYAPTSVNSTTGDVTLTSQTAIGKCVVTSPCLLQDLPITTHWSNPTTGFPRGHFELGASEGIGTKEYDDQTGCLVGTGDSGFAGGSNGDYFYQTDDYALFSDASGTNDSALVPDYEVYVGETHSVSAIDDMVAIWLSDEARERTGIPVAHRNYVSTTAAIDRAEEDLPVFQAIHCHIVDTGDDTENSLGSFLLPPEWTASPTTAYPILFSGNYDIHGAMFGGPCDSLGLQFLEILGDLYHHGSGPRLAVAVLWNGGGSGPALSMNRSAYDNVNQLIQDAYNELGADRDKVVFSGGSRGGTIALEMASNPVGHPYTAIFTVAASPFVKPAESLTTYWNYSYPGAFSAIDAYTGYIGSGHPSWEHPITEVTGAEQTMLTTFDTSVVADVNNLSIDSEDFLDALADQETSVILRLGSHDYYTALALDLTYAEHLQAHGIPTVVQIYYRSGHGRIANPGGPDLLTLMNKIFDNDYSLAEGSETDPIFRVQHFGLADFATQDYEEIESPAHIPLAVELPLRVPHEHEFTLSFTGEPDAGVRVRIRKLVTGWNTLLGSGSPPLEPPSSIEETHSIFADTTITTLVEDELEGATFGQLTATYTFPTATATAQYWYQVDYDPDGDTSYDVTLAQGDIAALSLLGGVGSPVIVVSTNPTIVGINDDTRTGGVAEAGQMLP